MHLSTSLDTAETIARRCTDTPVIFRVNTAAAIARGVSFYFDNKDTWMASPIPSTFLETL